MSGTSLPARADARVALLAEGVDRNTGTGDLKAASGVVALLAEGVDRNMLSLLRSV